MRAVIAILFVSLLATGTSNATDYSPSQIAALLESDGPAPPGFVRQKLDATDGLIFKPKDWFYTNHATPSGWLWTLSQEDSSKGSYRTGMRIQLFVGVSSIKMTAQQFAQYVLRTRRAAASTIVSECASSNVGNFTRQCLETIENSDEVSGLKFHIQYTVFWGGDMVVLATFGTPVDDWENMKSVAETMRVFRFIGKDLGKQESQSGQPIKP